MNVLVTGSAGFIGGYLVAELLEHGHSVIGVDNFSKYGPISRAYDQHPRYHFTLGDAKDATLMRELARDCDQIVAAAAMVGGVSYFNSFPYDLFAENERILASTLDAALASRRNGRLKRVLLISSSMVYETTRSFPSREEDTERLIPPSSAYGFQKLAAERMCQAAFDQYGLPFTIVRPFNCVGAGEPAPIKREQLPEGNLRQAYSHVVPDLIRKARISNDELEILGTGEQRRHFTYGGDLARGIRLCMESEAAENEIFNLSTDESHRIADLAELIWRRVQPEKPFRPRFVPGPQHDVLMRVPDTSKAKRILGFEARTPLAHALEEILALGPSADI